jgi:hypothetical protein
MSVASIIDPTAGTILPEYLPTAPVPHPYIETITAGTGISVDATVPTAPVVANTGVLSLTAGTGISLAGTASAPIVNNTGVLSLTAGTGISLAGTASAPIVNNTGLLTNSFPTQTAVYGPSTNPSPAVNTQYALNANLGMCSGASYAQAPTTATIPALPSIADPPVKWFDGIPNNPYFATSTSGSPVFSGSPLGDRIWVRINMNVVFTGTITDKFGVSIALKNSATSDLNTNNFYTIGTGSISSAPYYFEPIPYVLNATNYTLYQITLLDCFRVGSGSWLQSGQNINIECYGEWLNRAVTSGTIAFNPSILEGYEKSYLAT